MAIVICPDCGKEQDNLNKFCRNCGADLSKVEVAEDNAVENIEEKTEDAADSVSEVKSEPVAEPSSDMESEQAIESSSEEEPNIVEDSSSEDVPKVVEDSSSEEKPQGGNVLKCSDCGTELGPNVKFCPNCGKSTKDINKTSSVKFCPNCGTELNAGVRFCPNCGSNINQAISKAAINNVVERKTPIFSVILSFIFPGLGQFYNGQSTKGLYFIILAVVSWILFLILIGMIIYVLIWIWSIFDAYQSAEAINRGEILEDKLF